MDLFTRQVPFSIEPHRQYSRNAVIRTLSIGLEAESAPGEHSRMAEAQRTELLRF